MADVKFGLYETRKRAIAKALQLKGHSDFVPVDLAYYQHFLGFLFENIAFWEVPRIASRKPNDTVPDVLGFSGLFGLKILFSDVLRSAPGNRHVEPIRPLCAMRMRVVSDARRTHTVNK